MPRHSAVAKTIHGKPAGPREFRTAFFEAIKAGGAEGVTIKDMVKALGPEWGEPQNATILSHTFQNFKASGRITSPSRGVYVATVNDADAFTGVENAILDSIRKRGGICRWRDIAEDFDVRDYSQSLVLKPQGPNESDANYQMRKDTHSPYDKGARARLLSVIAVSTRIRQDFGAYGLYNIPVAQLDLLPLMGRWVIYTIRHGLRWADDGKADEDLIRSLLLSHFSQVGLAFAALREMKGLTLAQIAGEPDFRRILNGMADSSNTLRSDLTAEVRVAILKKHGIDPLNAKAFLTPEITKEITEAHTQLFDQGKDNLAIAALAAFEDGNQFAHRAAPLKLYTTYAGAFGNGLDAGALSRGMIRATIPEERLRPPPRTLTDEQQAERRRNRTDAPHLPEQWGEEQPHDFDDSDLDDEPAHGSTLPE